MASLIQLAKTFVKYTVIRPYYAVRNSWPVWFYFLNREPRALYKAHPAHLDDVQTALIAELKAKGIAQTSLEELLPGTDLLPRLQSYAEQQLEHAAQAEVKAFLVDPRNKPAVAELHDPLVQAALNDRILAVVNGYADMFMQLHDFRLNKTKIMPANAPAEHSQNWHRDSPDVKICKVFIYLTDVDETSGPFMYYPESHYHGKHHGLFPQTRPSGSYPDLKEAENKISKKDVKVCTGKAGTVIFCDTAGLHRGGYSTEKSRTMITIAYFSKGNTSIRKHYYLPEQYSEQKNMLSPAAQFALTKHL